MSAGEFIWLGFPTSLIADMGAAGVTIVAFCLACGALALWLIHHYVPHEHFSLGREGPDMPKLRRI